MVGGGKKTETTTTVQNNDPWSGSQSYLKEGMSRASDMLERGQGFNPYQGSTVVDYSGTTRQGMQGIIDAARSGALGTEQALQGARDVIGGGGAISSLGDIASGRDSITAGQYYEPIASGSEIAQGNPYLMQALEAGADEIQNRVGNEAASMGRGGSGAAAARMADSLGDYYSGALASDYNNMRNRQMQAISGLSGTQGANIANRAGATNQMLGSQLAYSQMIPGLESARYDPYSRMMDVGGMEDDLSARRKQDEVRRWEGEENDDWTRLANAMGIFSGAGSLGGQSTATVQAPVQRANPWTQAAGLGLTGLGLFGGMF